MTWLGRQATTAIVLLFSLAGAARAEEPSPSSKDSREASYATAYRLADPIPHLYTVSLGQSYDGGITMEGTGHEFTSTLAATIPVQLNSQYSWFIRPSLPYSWLVGSEHGDVDGIGAPRVETFFSPAGESRDELKIGPLVYLPAPSGAQIDTTQSGVGLSAVAITRPGSWALGLYGYQSFSVAGSDAGGTVNFTFAQPFISYVTSEAWTFTAKLESLTNWDSSGVSNPLYLNAGKTLRVFTVPVSITAGVHYYLSSSSYDYSSGFGGNLSVTFVLGTE